jgi:hypothetical protein
MTRGDREVYKAFVYIFGMPCGLIDQPRLGTGSHLNRLGEPLGRRWICADHLALGAVADLGQQHLGDLGTFSRHGLRRGQFLG